MAQDYIISCCYRLCPGHRPRRQMHYLRIVRYVLNSHYNKPYGPHAARQREIA
jgi:hypothetical protein